MPKKGTRQVGLKGKIKFYECYLVLSCRSEKNLDSWLFEIGAEQMYFGFIIDQCFNIFFVALKNQPKKVAL